MAASPAADIKAYVFTHDEDERRRLDGQHVMIHRAFGSDKNVQRSDGTSSSAILPPDVSPSKLRAVLDIGAGSCAWIADVAELPEVQTRRQQVDDWEAHDKPAAAGAEAVGSSGTIKNTSEDDAEATPAASPSGPVSLFACDITGAKFPPQASLDRLGVRAFEHDIRKRLPEGLRGLFDLVSMRLVLVWITKDEIRDALKNVKEAMAPGALFHLREAHMLGYYAPEEPLHEDDNEMAVDSYLWPLNKAIQEGRSRAGHLVHTAHELPPLLEESGFRILRAGRGVIPMGPMVRRVFSKDYGSVFPHIQPPIAVEPPLAEDQLESIESSTTKTFRHFEGMLREAWEGGYLRGYDGELVAPPAKGDAGDGVLGAEDEGEKKFEEIETRLWREFNERGSYYIVHEWVLEVNE